MVSASVAEVQNSLSYYIRIVRSQGETIQITERGEPIAFLNGVLPQTASDKTADFRQAITDWRHQYAPLFADEEIDEIFRRDTALESDVRHTEDFTE